MRVFVYVGACIVYVCACMRACICVRTSVDPCVYFRTYTRVSLRVVLCVLQCILACICIRTHAQFVLKVCDLSAVFYFAL